ncbi:serine hydrolase [Polaribacter litorisediminis]|uniref:serine hydrolase n=1 Tax=Polaribacter litorisediminis TaxID=1908341 RepID=UPI001CBBD0DE|nr:serine hydrolase [Polaribacter litorisediminis]UAM98880.1 serine hydrolase [Polaribacter litorisediminis]
MKKSIVVLVTLILSFSGFSQENSNFKLEDKINEVFQSYAHYNRFIGNVLISKENKIIYNKSFGFADVEKNKKNSKKSIFSIASVTKPLTAVGIMKLVEEGKLSLETPISTFYPNFIPEYSKKITIRHLLNHSSGMQANIGRIDDQGNGLMPGENAITIDELLEKFKDSKLKFEPGKGYEYNNFGYTLLANIIEKVTGKSYADYMEETIFEPASMKNTAVNTYKKLRYKAYSHIGLGMQSFKKLDYPIHTSWIKGAGNINATAKDLYNFMTALENGTLLKPLYTDKIYSNTQPTGYNDTRYGFGWRIENKGGEKWINHTGLLPGTASIIGFLPEKNIKIIILSNATTTDLISESTFQGKNQFVDGAIIDNLIKIIQNKAPELLPIAVKSKNKKVKNSKKTYSLDNEHSLMITKEDDSYLLKTIGEEPWSIFTYQFSRNAAKNNKASEAALFFANAMSTQNFEGLAKYGNDEMKGFLGSDQGVNQLKGMWDYFIKQAGTFKSYNIYKIIGEKNKNVHVRFHFEKEDVGFVLGLNASNKIQGMFMDDAIKTSTIASVKLIPIHENEFFINGHQNEGMQDLRIKVSEKGMILIDGNIEFNAQILKY